MLPTTLPSAVHSPPPAQRATEDLLLKRWAGRVTLLGVFAILLLTLFPYQFFTSGRATARLRQPVSSWLSPVPAGLDDITGNVLLFVPLGFGIAIWLRKRRCRQSTQVLAPAALSLVLSFTIETLQNFLPGRDPSWVDVLTNFIGGTLGGLCSLRLCLAVLARIDWLRGRVLARAGWKLPLTCGLLYSAIVSAVLLPRERSAKLSNWDASYPLLVGNERTGDRPWRGWVEVVEIASRAVSASDVRTATHRGLAAVARGAMLSTIRFEGPGPYQDARGLIPALRWRLSSSHNSKLRDMQLGDGAWLESSQPPAQLAYTLERTNQFTVHVICTSAATGQEGPARILSYSLDPLHRNLTLGQQEEMLTIRLRTPFTGMNGIEPALDIPGVFRTPRQLDLAVTYDGYRLKAFLDGNRVEPSLELTPLSATESQRQPDGFKEARGFRVLFFGGIFAPLGFLLALAAGAADRLEKFTSLALLSAGLLLPPLAFERTWMALTSGSLNPFHLLWACGATAAGAAVCEWTFAALD